jgi:hypothetical protein
MFRPRSAIWVLCRHVQTQERHLGPVSLRSDPGAPSGSCIATFRPRSAIWVLCRYVQTQERHLGPVSPLQ